MSTLWKNGIGLILTLVLMIKRDDLSHLAAPYHATDLSARREVVDLQLDERGHILLPEHLRTGRSHSRRTLTPRAHKKRKGHRKSHKKTTNAVVKTVNHALSTVGGQLLSSHNVVCVSIFNSVCCANPLKACLFFYRQILDMIYLVVRNSTWVHVPDTAPKADLGLFLFRSFMCPLTPVGLRPTAP